MAYLNINTGTYPISEQQVRQANPQISFSTPFKAPDEYVWVFPTPVPTYDPNTQSVRELTPTLDQLNHHVQVWEVYDLSAEVIEALRKARVPQSVSPRQIRQALTQVSLRAGVEAAVAAGDQDLKDWWEFATAFERNHPMVLAMATSLGVTEQQLDNLFTLAGSL